MKSGFTMIELLVAVIIVGILAALAVPRFMQIPNKGKLAEAQLVVKQLWEAEQLYYEEYGHYLPVFDVFNAPDAKLKGFTISKPGGQLRFTYDILERPRHIFAIPDLKEDVSLRGYMVMMDDRGKVYVVEPPR